MSKWSRNEKISFAGVIIAILMTAVTVLIPEMRHFVGLKLHDESKVDGIKPIPNSQRTTPTSKPQTTPPPSVPRQTQIQPGDTRKFEDDGTTSKKLPAPVAEESGEKSVKPEEPNRQNEPKGIATETQGSTATPTSPATVGRAIESAGFVFKPINCLRKGDTLVCTINFQNMGDRPVTLQVGGSSSAPHPISYLYDNYGNQYSVEVKIGDKQSRYSIVQSFLPEIPVNVHFITEGIHPDATHMTALISVKEGSNPFMGKQKQVVIKNIPVSK